MRPDVGWMLCLGSRGVCSSQAGDEGSKAGAVVISERVGGLV